MQHIKAISISLSKRLVRMIAEELGITLDLSLLHPKCRDNTEQTYLEIRSRGTSKRLQWSGGKLKSRKRDGKESSSRLDGRRNS